MGRVAGALAQRANELIQAVESQQRTDPVETITAELFPLCDALRWISRRGPRVLADRRVGWRDRPLWLVGISSRVVRDPLGRVLILGAWNYPLFLPGVQAAQALAAGNQVLLKPAPGAELATQLMVDCFYDEGIAKQDLKCLPSDVSAAQQAIQSGVDLVVLTGSATTGRKVLGATAPTLTPSIVELSGCDGVIVLPGFDPDRLISAIQFGLNLNSGATCIGPRRLIPALPLDELKTLRWQLRQQLTASTTHTVHPSAVPPVIAAIESARDDGLRPLTLPQDASPADSVAALNEVIGGLRERSEKKPLILDDVAANASIASSDLFAPILSIVPVSDQQEAIDAVNQCQYRLAASVFGRNDDCQRVASQLAIGCVTINDLIAATADPRLPFGGRGESGFGVTRGPEGLLAMTHPKVVITRRGRLAPHLSPRNDGDENLLRGALEFQHGATLRQRFDGLLQMVSRKRDSTNDPG
ncbi:MAG: aldehyde dehydrogenase family protein, partial [Planctomycetota bacterium]